MSAQGEQMRVSRAFVLPWVSWEVSRRPRPKPAAACFGLAHLALGHRIARSTEQLGPLIPGL